jgi:hypothetical protein
MYGALNWHSNIFLWMMFLDRLQTAVRLKNRKWDGTKECKLCGVVQDFYHLFLKYPNVQFAQCWVRDAMGWDFSLTSLENFLTVLGGVPTAEQSLQQGYDLPRLFGRREMIGFSLIN